MESDAVLRVHGVTHGKASSIVQHPASPRLPSYVTLQERDTSYNPTPSIPFYFARGVTNLPSIIDAIVLSSVSLNGLRARVRVRVRVCAYVR